MSNRRRQLKVDYPGQLFTPEQLALGQDIALLEYDGGLPLYMKLARATGAIIIANIVQQSQAEQRRAAVDAFRADDEPKRLIPQFRGTVQSIGEIGIHVMPVYGRHGTNYGHEYDGRPEALPPVAAEDQWPLHFYEYPELGLAPIPGGQEGAGKWLPHATVLIAPPQALDVL
ncbi:MAG TPA: hypothetical protein VLI54_01430 [Bacillota bacterium]|nr:hypothetical protein [Bacillota bacterium]